MSDQAAVPPVESAPGLSQWERVFDTFIAPVKTFTDIRRNTSWWLPWLILSILAIALAFTVQQQVGWSQIYHNMLQQNPKAMEQLQKASTGHAAEMINVGTKATEISVFAEPLLLLLAGLVISAVLWGTLNFVFGGHARFGQVYAVWFYASLPLALMSLLAIISLYSGLDPGSFNLKNPVGTNIGYYLPSDSPHWLAALLASADVLKIWTAVLLTVGCAIVAQIKRSRAAIAVFGWWFLFIILSVGSAALTGR